MNLHEIRLKNLHLAIKTAGGQGKLADLIGVKSSYFSQIKNPDHPTNMGDEIATRIEKALGLESGWMDTPHEASSTAEDIAKKSIENYGFIVMDHPPAIAIDWQRWSRPDFVVTKKGSNLQVFVEIHPKFRLGIPIMPSNTKNFVYIRNDHVKDAGVILSKHFERWNKTSLNEDITNEDSQMLSANEIELLGLYRKMSEQQQQALLNHLKA